MADTEFDWGKITGTAIARLRAPKVPPVPEPLVKLAQKSWDEETVLKYHFDSEEKAAAFAKLMRKAGAHTTPVTTVSVSVDPEETGDPKIIAWKAGKKRGRTATASV